ncbi:MAG: twin-arginine translocase subunit TatC [Verrucomicrobia subdivision 3 bacterium]|nr:twin-arginine translocase subunit TatC [Limisphaerales bacterium]
MAKEPEDKHGASDFGGDGTPAESNPPQDDLPATPPEQGDEQSELPLGDEPTEDGSAVEFPQSDFPKADFSEPQTETAADEDEDEDEPVHDDQAHDETHHEDPHHAGELDSGHDDPYHDEYSHDYEDEYHQEYHDDYHEHDHGEYEYADGNNFGGDDNGGNDDGGDDANEGFGGPIKPFLDHLEDFRFMVMKCVVAVVAGMMIALIGSPYIVKFLTWPLERAQQIEQVNTNPDKRAVPVKFGSGVVSHIRESDLKNMASVGNLRGSFTNTAEISALRLVPTDQLGTNGNRFAIQLEVDNNSSDREPWHVELKAFGPLKSFFIALKIGLYGGITIAIPFILIFVAQFVLPALHIKEKKWVFRLAGMGSVLFMLGAAFCYFVIMQVALWASVGFAGMLGFGADEWMAEEYIGFVCKFMVGMGLAFEMPMILLFLVKVGILDYEKLSRLRMYAVVANIILAAVITPTGDPVTLALVAVPMQLLYELSTIIAWFMARNQAREEAAFDDED